MVAHRRGRPGAAGPSSDSTSPTPSVSSALQWRVPPVHEDLAGMDGIAALADVGKPELTAPPITNPRTQAIYDKHMAAVDGANLQLANHAWSEKRFVSVFTRNEARYVSVALQTGVPAVLIAAIHFRESGGDFSTYLHNGEKLGKPTTLVPKGILFHAWEPAAVHAMTKFEDLRKELGLSAGSDDMAAMATFAEHYNGLGYHHRDLPSPYVYSGTDAYQKGKYVADGVFDPNAVDKQLGVMAMVQLGQGVQSDGDATAAQQTPAPAPKPPVAHASMGTRLLREGSRGPTVIALQDALCRAGHALQADGVFGPRTARAVRAFQTTHGLAVDGLVGPKTRAALGE